VKSRLRIGKTIEVNALWHGALETMVKIAPVLAKSSEPFSKMAEAVKKNFTKFWNSSAGYCYDLIDAPGINEDPSLRPNQILAVSLPNSPLTAEQQKCVVDTCAGQLLTAHGLRSLGPRHPDYQGHYGGGPAHRGGAYRQGTVWGWLLGPFALAHFRVYGDRKRALSFLEPLGKQIHSHGIGILSEIFDGDPPFTPRGCIAQAWTVGETMRAWLALQPE
jgi:predicted glycogen debranching enzyme